MPTETERLRAALEDVGGIHGKNAWNPDSKWPTELAREWHNGYITCAATVSIKARAALDPAQAAEDDALWRAGSHDTDSEWWARTGHCGSCGTVASSCDCDGTCGCWADHGPPLTPWRSLPARLDEAREVIARVEALCDEADARLDASLSLGQVRAALRAARPSGSAAPHTSTGEQTHE
jgi:hypothetical protein